MSISSEISQIIHKTNKTFVGTVQLAANNPEKMVTGRTEERAICVFFCY